MRKTWVGALSLLMACGLAYSCKDDYTLDDELPSWLGSSIYNYLQSKGTYKNTLKLIDDLGYTEVLSKTGSKTLFVANDSAYATFYKNNSWGVTKYEDLTSSMKKLLLNSSMLDNPYLLEMMPNVGGSSSITKNKCLRQATSMALTDSIPWLSWSSPVIPKSDNASDKDYWARFRTSEKGGMYLALDATLPWMTHFIAGQLADASITDDDFEKIVGMSRDANDVHIYYSKVVDQDVTCQNGYVDVLDRVLVTPQNMAELIRTNGNTNVFSHMLDRFSAPFYNASLTSAYQQIMEGVDSVFQKRYFSTRSQGGNALKTDPKGNTVSYYLSYDPGWNGYSVSAQTPEAQDMGAMFVPSDESLTKYFLTGGGVFLMERYADLPNTSENLLHNIDQIPLNVIQALINNLMKASFIETVPSKYLKIMNDARDQMFANISSVDAFKAKIDTCLIANNGVVYVMNEVYTPATYASVSAPALVGNNLHIVNAAITADDGYVTNPNSAPLNAFFSTYLLAMSSRFSLFLPTDQAMNVYYDIASLGFAQPRALTFSYNSKLSGSEINKVTCKSYKYDPLTGQIDSTRAATVTSATDVRNNRLKDLLDSHIVVHEDGEEDGINGVNEYYVTKGGSAIQVLKHGSTNPLDFTVRGGWQIEKEGRDDGVESKVIEFYDKTEETNGYGNGMTYVIDHPIQTTSRSVYTVLKDDDSDDNPYEEFYNLCIGVSNDLLEVAGFTEDEMNNYYIFNSSTQYLGDYNVRFFNAYKYTIYVPTNAAIEDAINHGLPTWESIREFVDSHKNGDGLLSEENQQIARAMITCLVNFLRYHFHDEEIFADKKAVAATSYESSCIDLTTNRYIPLTVTRLGNNQMTVADKDGHVRNVTSLKNVMARDIELNSNVSSATKIESSSYVVIHQVDGVLNFTEVPDGDYRNLYSTTSDAKRFNSKFRIRK